jgi:hypothetical protein
VLIDQSNAAISGIEVPINWEIKEAVYVTGPEVLRTDDNSALYKFSMKNMPADISAITLTFSVEDSFYTERSLYGLNGWDIISQSEWVAEGAYWVKTLTLAKAGGEAAGNFEFFGAMLNYSGAIGTTQVEIVDIVAATPGGVILLRNAGPAVTVAEPYSRYDVNRDGVVDLADVAAAAYFFMSDSSDANWSTPVKFDNGASGIYVAPKDCDVNLDGVVDIADLILILANFTN